MSDRLHSDAQLTRVLQALARRWWVIALVALVAGGAAYGLAKRQSPRYAATAAVLFQNSQLDQQLFGTAVSSGNPDPTRQAQTNQALIELPTVARMVAGDLHLSTARVLREVAFGSDATSDVLDVTATDANPALAATIANTYVGDYIEFRRTSDQAQLTQAERTIKAQLAAIPAAQRNSSLAQGLQSRSNELGLLASLQTGNAEVVQTAVPPRNPSSPHPVTDGIIGLVLGLLLGALLVAGLERFDRRVKTAEETEEIFSAPVLGAIPDSPALQGPGALGTPRDGDAFRMVRSQLRYFDVDRAVRRILVTSSGSEEGKSTVALNLARTATPGDDKRALLIEADLRRPSLSRLIGADALAGLSELLGHSQDLASGLAELVITPEVDEERTGRPAFDVLVAGSAPPNPQQLLESNRMTELLEVADARYDLVIVDTPPLNAISDAMALVHQVDGVVIVSRLGRTRRDYAVRLSKQLRSLNARVLGIVINGVTRSAADPYGYHGDPRARADGRRRRRLSASGHER